MNPDECYLIIIKGTNGSGKTTLSEYIKDKYEKLNFKVFHESLDKY